MLILTHWMWLCLAFILCLSLPITMDEAYYQAWSQTLKWGYFDHPPMIAFAKALSPDSKGRFMTFALTVLSLFLLKRILTRHQHQQGNPNLIGLYAVMFSLAGLAPAIIATPDSTLLFCWTWALYEASKALEGEQKRWCLAGIATGLGLLSKYTMVLIVPVFFFTLLFKKPKQLRTIWPYLGFIFSLLIFSPHIYWNSYNHFQPIKFQLRHGFGISQEHFYGDNPFKLAQKAETGSIEERFGLLFDQKCYEHCAPATPSSSWKKRLQNVVDFISGQLALWGLLGFLIPPVLFRMRRLFYPISSTDMLLKLAALLPLGFFATISLITKVEANWAAMSIIGLTPYFNATYQNWRKLVSGACILNGILVLIILSHSHKPWLPTPSHKDRILFETHGYQKLSALLENITPESFVFADTYQLTAMLNFYKKSNRQIYQWPGCSRPSEFILNRQLRPTKTPSSKQDVYLISRSVIPFKLEGLKPVRHLRIQDCTKGHLRIQENNLKPEQIPCSPVHTWFLTAYSSTDRQSKKTN